MTDPLPPDVPAAPRRESFWRRSATRAAIGVTAFHVAAAIHVFVAARWGDVAAYSIDSILAAWTAAFGINIVAPRS